MEQKSLEQMFKKWSPILDALKVTDDKIKKIMVEYAEYCLSPEYYQKYENDIAQNLLPVSLKILSQLNIKDKNVVLKEDHKIGFEDMPTKSFSISINTDELISMKESVGFGGAEKMESVVIQELVNYINKELETKENLYISNLVQSISIISTDIYSPRIILISKIYID